MVGVGCGDLLAAFVEHDQVEHALQLLRIGQRVADRRVVALGHGRSNSGLQQQADFGTPQLELADQVVLGQALAVPDNGGNHHDLDHNGQRDQARAQRVGQLERHQRGVCPS